MIVIVDGYNFLRAMFYKVRGRLDKQREQLIKSLCIYGKRKGHAIVVVFDGGVFNGPSREMYDGVLVYYSGKGRSADDVIVDYAKENVGKEMLLVSSDRELRARCKRYNVDSIGVKSFESIFKEVLLSSVESDSETVPVGTVAVIKYKKDDESENNPELDVLMEQAAMIFDKDSPSRDSRRALDKKKKKQRILDRKIGKL